jgi:MoaA/NifB/PqqE/SkfB family radical SAM enzyme
MSGAPKKFTLLIMPDLTIDSAEVKEVIERLRDSQFVIKTALTPNKLKMNKEVVELEQVDRVEQLPASNNRPPRGEVQHF